MNKYILAVFFVFFSPLQVESKFKEVAFRMRDYEIELYNRWEAETTQTLPVLMKRNLLIMVNSAGTVYEDFIQPNPVRCSDRETYLLAVRKRWSKLISVSLYSIATMYLNQCFEMTLILLCMHMAVIADCSGLSEGCGKGCALFCELCP